MNRKFIVGLVFSLLLILGVVQAEQSSVKIYCDQSFCLNIQMDRMTFETPVEIHLDGNNIDLRGFYFQRNHVYYFINR